MTYIVVWVKIFLLVEFALALIFIEGLASLVLTTLATSITIVDPFVLVFIFIFVVAVVITFISNIAEIPI